MSSTLLGPGVLAGVFGVFVLCVFTGAKADIVLLEVFVITLFSLGLYWPFLGLIEFFMNSVCLNSLLVLICCFAILVASQGLTY